MDWMLKLWSDKRVDGAWRQQGDQIGRIFAFWAVVNFLHFLKISEEPRIFGLLLSTVQVIQ
jgi:hypothetical protein